MIYSIVVLYNPDQHIAERLITLSKESDFMFVVINQSEPFENLQARVSNTEFIPLGENLGLAKALNIGLKKCLNDERCKFIALFDQDSVPSVGSLKTLQQAIEKSAMKIAAAGSIICDIKTSTCIPISNNLVTEVNVIISSGSLIPVSAIKEIGLMDETLFIDYIDYEWCYRAKSKGYSIVRVNQAQLQHNMGDTFVNFLGKRKPLHKNKLRHYYIIRNELIMLCRPYFPLTWKIIHFVKLFYRIPGYIFLSKNKLQTLIIIYKALFDFASHYHEYQTIKF